MATIARLLADGDGVRIADGDGAYISIPGDTLEAEPSDTPTGLAYDRATGALTWDDQNDATSFRVLANEVTEGTNGPRTRVVGTVNYPTLTINDGALQDGESRTYEVRATDDHSALEGRGQTIFVSHQSRKL